MKRLWIWCIAVIIVLFSDPLARAQLPPSAVDSATRETERSMREEETERLMRKAERKPEIEEEAEGEDTGPKYHIKKIKLEGCKYVDAEEFRPLVKEYENRDISFKGLEKLARNIQKEYLKKGIIATCVVPPQKVKDGEVTIKVVEAEMGTLNIEGNRYFDDDVLASYWMISRGELLDYDKMLRSLELMNENPDRKVKGRISSGKEAGTSDVTLVSDTRFPLHSIVRFDREGVLSTGRERIGLGGKDNNFLFVDDTLVSGVVFGKSFYTGYFYHSIPVSRRGTTLIWGYSQSRAIPKKQFTRFNIMSKSENWSAYLYQDILSREGMFAEAYGGFDFNDKLTKTVDGVFNKDRLRVMRLGGNIMGSLYGGLLYLRPEYSQGLNFFGASGKNALSSRGASSNFTKFNLDTRYTRTLPFHRSKFNLALKAQLAGEKLVPQEEMFLGGIDSVRGYPMGDYLADNAVQTNFELLCPFFFIPEHFKLPFDPNPLRDEIEGLFFCDFAYGVKRGHLPSERANMTMVGIGPGLRVRLYDQVYLRFAWGFPVGRKPITETAPVRFHFALDFEVQFLGMLADKIVR